MLLHSLPLAQCWLLCVLVCTQVILLTAREDGSSPRAHLSQTDRSLSEHGPRILRAADSVEGDRFGRAVALGPNLALIGADSAPCGAAQAGGECHPSNRGPGAVYVFEKDWVDEAVGGYSEAGYREGSRWWGMRSKLTPPDGISGQRFGAVVALCPVMHTAVVGAPFRPVTGNNESGFCANEGHVCECHGQVRFGHAETNAWAPRLHVSGSIMCLHEVFDDPAPGRVKTCECLPDKARQVKNQSGSVYVHQQDHGGKDAWGLVNILSLQETAYAATYGIHGYEYFGSSVSVSGRYIAVGCPRCHGRNVREISAGIVFLYRCASINASTSQCLSWQLLKELVPEPDGTESPSFCASLFAPSQAQADWTCHREMDNFGNSVSVLGCCNELGQLLTADARTGRASEPGGGFLRDGRALCKMDRECPEAVVAVGALMDSTSALLGEGYDRRNHGAVYLFHNRAADDSFPQVSVGFLQATGAALDGGRPSMSLASTSACPRRVVEGRLIDSLPPSSAAIRHTCSRCVALLRERLIVCIFGGRDVSCLGHLRQVKNLTSSGRNESDYVQQSQRVTAMDEDEDTMFGKHVSLSACKDANGHASACLVATRTTCLDRVCRTPLSPATGIAICYCEPSEHGLADELYVFERHRNAPDSWGLLHKFCDRNFSCPAPPNCTQLYATADKRVPFEVLQTHDGPGDDESEWARSWPGPRDTPHTFLDSGPGSTLGQGAGANPNGDETRTDYNCLGADQDGSVNAGPCVPVPCTPFGLQLTDLFFGNPVHIVGDQGLVGDYSWLERGAAFLVPRELLSQQRSFDFTWVPAPLDILQG